MTRKYVVTYQVAASTELDAISKAGEMLRSAVRLIEVQSTEETAPGWWRVSMWVSE